MSLFSSLERSKGLIVASSALLVTLTFVSLMVTDDMGFTRDESFYFRYGRQYASWFHELERAKDAERAKEVLSRKEVIDTWRGNFEHPPLMKSAFGAAWRHLAFKDRRLVVLPTETSEGGKFARITGLAPADGFEVGADVELLAAQPVGESAEHPSRRIGAGRVVQRMAREARVSILESDERLELCRGASKTRSIAGCQARESALLKRFDEATAMRIPGVLASVLAVLFTFLLGLEVAGWFAGTFAALAFLFVPRHFFHAHLITFDMGIVAAMMATLYAFWRSRSDRRWALVTGLAWGTALLIKHNAFFMPVPLVLFWLWSSRAHAKLDLRRLKVTLPPLPLSLLVMPVVALPMLFIFWPKLWFDPYRAVADYFQFHLQHDHYMQWYFGQPLEVPPFPWAFPFVMSAWTLPEAFLLLILCGAVMWGWRAYSGGDPEHRFAFLMLNGLAPVLLIALPSTPIFGGVKHWMTGMPLLLICGGYALAKLCQNTVLRLPWVSARRVGVVLVAGLVLAAPIRASIASAPFGTGYYNALVAGGAQGAADAQLTRLYWGHTSRQALDWVNEKAPTNAKVFFQNTTRDAYEMYRRVGLLRHDIRYHRSEVGADIALIEPQKSFEELDRRVRQEFGVQGPEWVVRYQEVPMLRVYARHGGTKTRALPATGKASLPGASPGASSISRP